MNVLPLDARTARTLYCFQTRPQSTSTVLYPSGAACPKDRPGAGKLAQRMMLQAAGGGLVFIGQGSTGNVSVVGSTLTRISAVRNVEYASTIP